jgi:hypothetical protein
MVSESTFKVVWEYPLVGGVGSGHLRARVYAVLPPCENSEGMRVPLQALTSGRVSDGILVGFPYAYLENGKNNKSLSSACFPARKISNVAKHGR